MDYVIFKGFEKVGGFYPNPEEAKSAIDGKGIYNICAVISVDGRLKITSRESVVIK
jgi:hypothetical protein